MGEDGLMAIHITGVDEADQLLTDSHFALLVGMMLDQQYPMQMRSAGRPRCSTASAASAAAAIAAADPEEFAALFATPPALHRFPGRWRLGCRSWPAFEDRYDGDTARCGRRRAPARSCSSGCRRSRASASRRRRSSSRCWPSSSTSARRLGVGGRRLRSRATARSLTSRPGVAAEGARLQEAEEGRGEDGVDGLTSSGPGSPAAGSPGSPGGPVPSRRRARSSPRPGR